jgi:hypothetical protein
MTFTHNQPVVCISTDNLGLLGYGDEVMPTLNSTYTVRDVVIDHFGVEGLLLMEIKNDRLPYQVGDKIVDFEKPFASWRFRPLVADESKKEMEAV